MITESVLPRNAAILLARDHGVSARTLGLVFGVSPQRISQIVKAQRRRLVRAVIPRSTVFSPDEPNQFGRLMLFCELCDFEYDRRDCEIHTSQPVYSFTCPRGHSAKAPQVWRSREDVHDSDFLKACGIRKEEPMTTKSPLIFFGWRFGRHGLSAHPADARG